MKKRWIYHIGMFVVGVLLMSSACAPKAAPVGPVPAPEAAPGEELARPAWQAEWDELIRMAKREGMLSIYATSIAPAARDALYQSMKNKFGVTLEILPLSQAMLIPKLDAERRAGLFTADVLVSGPSAPITMKAKGMLDPLNDVLFLPEVVDKKLWISHEGVFYDKDHMIIGGFATPTLTILVNRNLVRPREIKGWEDLLNPKWKGKIVMNDPTIEGGPFTAFMSALHFMGEEYLRKLAHQEPIITRSTRDPVEWVVKGKFPIAVGAKSSILERFTAAGARELVEAIAPVEGVGTGTGGHSMVLINRAPHPNAAKLFLNWTQTREIQTFLARESGNASRRIDVSNDWLRDYSVVQPGMKTLEITEEIQANREKYIKIFKDIFKIP